MRASLSWLLFVHTIKYTGSGDIIAEGSKPSSGNVKATLNGQKRHIQVGQTDDRYAVLQRKLDDLERLHVEGKASVSLLIPSPLSQLIKFIKVACRDRAP